MTEVVKGEMAGEDRLHTWSRIGHGAGYRSGLKGPRSGGGDEAIKRGVGDGSCAEGNMQAM